MLLFGLMISNGISLLLGQSPKFLPWLFIHHQWFFILLGKERGHRLAIKPWWKLCTHSLENCSHSHSHTHPLWWAIWGGTYPPNTSQLEPPPLRAWLCPAVPASSPLTLCPLSFLIPCFVLILDLCTWYSFCWKSSFPYASPLFA